MSTDADTITDERIAAIADRMVEEGKRVSPVTIWTEVRGGSLVEIVASLQRWREARHGGATESQVQAGLPEDLAETMTSAASRIWTASQHETEKAFNQKLTTASQKVDTAHAERDEALVEYQKMVEQAEAERERLATVTSALTVSENTAAQLGAELVAATSRAEAGETRIEELLQRISVQDADLEATKASVEEERLAREELTEVVSNKRDEITRLTEERDLARQEVTTLDHACQAKSDEVTRWTGQASMASLRADAAEVRIEELAQRRSALESDLEATKIRLETTRSTLEQESTAREALVAAVASKTDEITRIVEERDQAQQNVAVLNETVQAKSEEIARWTQDAHAATSRAELADARIEQLVQSASTQDANLNATKTLLEEERAAREELIALVASKTEEIARLTEARDQALQNVTSLNATVQAKSAEVTRWSHEASMAAVRAEAAETRNGELAQRESALEADLEATKTTLAEERKTRDELTAVVASKNDEIARVTEALNVAHREVANLSDTVHARSEEVTRWSQDAGSALSRAEAAEARIAEHVQHASTQDAALEQAKAALEEERRAREALSEVVASKSDEITQVTHQRDQAHREAATAGEAYEAKSAEVSRLAEELNVATSRARDAGAQANASFEQLAELEANLQAARAELAEERKIAAARTDETSAQLDELRRVTQQLEEARQQASAATEAKTAAGADLIRLSQEMSAAKQRTEAAERLAAQLEQRVAALTEAAAKAAQRGQHPTSGTGESENAEVIAALQRQIAAQAKSHAKALDEVRSNAEQWVAHAKDLKQRLGHAGEKILFIDARSTGEVALVRRLASELERLKPDHELVARETQQKLIGATMNQQLAQKGYRYDPSTAVMSKIAG